MTATAWEAFIARLLGLGVNAVQGLIRIALIIALAYVATRLLRAGLARLEDFLINATARSEDTALATSKRIKTLSSVIWTLSAGLLWFLVVDRSQSDRSQYRTHTRGSGRHRLGGGFGAQHLVRDW